MKYFLFRLIPPRSTFSLDMTEAERKLMQEHIGYWSELAEKRTVIVFGPVADPKGSWGVGIVEVPHESAAQALVNGDPAMKSGAGFQTEILPMPRAIFRN